MRILLLPNDVIPGRCGVGDYTSCLARELIKTIEVKTLSICRWNCRCIPNCIRQMKDLKPDLVHIQFPAACYNRTLAPFLFSYYSKLVSSAPLICTFHEFSRLCLLSKIAMAPWLFIGDHLIFTNGAESQSLAKYFPFVRKKSIVIPIGSNIEITPRPLENRNKKRVVYFGLVAPQKGMERMISLAQYAEAQGSDYEFILMGSIVERHKDYYQKLLDDSKSCRHIVWKTNCSPEEVNRILGSSLFAFLPYPDGASEKGGSLCTVFSAGLIPITTIGKYTTKNIMDAAYIFQNNEQTLQFLDSISHDHQKINEWMGKSLQYAKHIQWPAIAHKHLELYGDILQRKNSPLFEKVS